MLQERGSHFARKQSILIWMKNEKDLIEAALQGDEDAFELLLYPYRNNMLNLSFRMVGNLEDAKEVCQEAILKIFKYMNGFKRGKSFKNWMYKIVVNASNDFLRKKRRHEDIFAVMAAVMVVVVIFITRPLYFGVEDFPGETILSKRHPQQEAGALFKSPQDVVSMTMISKDTGLKVVWILNKNFNLEENE